MAMGFFSHIGSGLTVRLLLSFLFLLTVTPVPVHPLPLVEEAREARQLSDRALRNAREDAVRLARRGELEKALKQLQRLHKMAPDNKAVLWDYMAVLSWAGRHDEVSRLRRRNDMSSAPDWLVGMLRTPGSTESTAKSAVSSTDTATVTTSADDGSASGAGSVPGAGPTTPKDPRQAAMKPASTTHQTAGPASEEPPTAADPEPEAFRQRVLSLHGQGQFIEAWHQASGRPELFNESQRLRLQGDQAAERIRRASQWQADPGKRLESRREAEAALAAFCHRARQQEAGEAVRRCRRDSVVWYANSGRPEKAAGHYAELLQDEGPIPAYVHRAAIDLYLALKRPQDAEAALQRLEQATGRPQEGLRGEILLSRGEYAAARDHFLMAAESHSGDNDHPAGGPEQLALRQRAVTAEAWRGHLDHAQRRAERLQLSTPDNLSLGLQLEQLYRWQGWPRRAGRERRRLAGIDPDNGALLRAQIHAAIDEGRFAQAQATLDRFRTRYPGDSATDAMAEELATASGARFTSEWRRANTTGEGISEATRGSFHRQRLYSPALRQWNDTRLFLDRHHYHADYRGGRGSIRRRGAGLLTEHRDWGLTLGWHEQIDASEASGVYLSGHLEVSDHWGMDLDYQQESERTPIRAAINDIDASSTGIAVRHHRHDGHDYRFAAWLTDFSDDNRRIEFAVSGSQPLYRDSPHRLLLREFIGYSRNSETATPYFSPENAGAAELQLDYTGVLHSGSSGRWEHNAVAGAGVGTQAGFSASPIWDFSYEHRYRLNRHFTTAVGVQWASRMYDGDNELTETGFLRLEWRFQ